MKKSILDTLNPSPVYTFTIPSTGKKVKFRPFTVGEEQALLMVKESSDSEMIVNNVKELIKSCSHDEINPDELAYFDIEYFFLQLRSKSVGEEIEVSLRCTTEDCKGEIPIIVNLDDIKAPKIEKGANIVKLNEKVSIVMKYPGFETMEYLMKDKVDFIKIIADLMETITNDDNVYNASDFSEEEKIRFIKNMNSKTLNKITKFVEDSPKISHSVKGKCVKCKKEHTFTFSGIKHFFV